MISVASPAVADDLDTARDSDAAAGRSYFAPTALTSPARTGSFNLRALAWPVPVALAGATAGVTDRIEVGVGGLAWIDFEDESRDPEHQLFGDAKVQVVRTSRLAVALTAAMFRRAGYLEDPEFEAPYRVPRSITGGVGLIATACFADCRVLLTEHIEGAVELWGGDRRYGGAGASLRYGRGAARLIVDASLVDGPGPPRPVGYVGLRVALRRFALDLGLDPWPGLGLSIRI